MGKVVLIACTNVGRAMIEAIKNSPALSGVELSGVVDLKPEAAVEKANYDAYTDLVKKYSLNIYYCEEVNEPECVDFIKGCAPDIIIQSGWSQKFKQELLSIPKYACIGEHPAPLPKGRGAACINWAIITGEREWGDTFFKMEMQYDTGLIYAQEHFVIEDYDDVKTVYDKVAASSVVAIKKHLLDWTEGKLDGKVQDDSKATHYPRRRPSDGEFSFDRPAKDVYDHIRGQARPYPGAFFNAKLDGVMKKIYVWRAAYNRASDVYPEGYSIKCSDGKDIILLRVQPEGETEIWGAEIRNRLEL